MWMVTGATGHIGRTVLRLLADEGHAGRLLALARDPVRAKATLPSEVAWRIADYADRTALTSALAGVDRLLLVASDGPARDVLQHHANVIAAAAAAGVDHIIFLSIVDIAVDSPFYYAPVYRDAEQRLRACGIKCTVLRSGLYADFVSSHWLWPALSTGVLEVPAGRGRMALVARDDVAAAAAAALSSDVEREQAFELTGPQAMDGEGIAIALRRAYGVPVAYRSCAVADYLLRAWSTLDDPWPHAFSSLFASIAQGRYERVGLGVHELTGRPPISLEEFLNAQRPACA